LTDTPNNRLVIMDLDGTITTSDTFIPFLLGWFLRHPRFRAGLLFLPLGIFLFLLGLFDTTRLKEIFLKAFIGGLNTNLVQSWAREFASRIIASGCRPRVLGLIKEFHKNGDRLIICSASPQIYVRFIAERLGIVEVISTELEIKDGCYTGKLFGKNCSGEEKLRRIKKYLGTDHYNGVALAYGDRKSDLSVLKWADEGWLLKGNKLIPARSYSMD